MAYWHPECFCCYSFVLPFCFVSAGAEGCLGRGGGLCARTRACVCMCGVNPTVIDAHAGTHIHSLYTRTCTLRLILPSCGDIDCRAFPLSSCGVGTCARVSACAHGAVQSPTRFDNHVSSKFFICIDKPKTKGDIRADNACVRYFRHHIDQCLTGNKLVLNMNGNTDRYSKRNTRHSGALYCTFFIKSSI